MPPPWRPPAHLLLVCLFTSFQQFQPRPAERPGVHHGIPAPQHPAVSAKTFLLCGISLCLGERCCDGQCCSLRPGFQEETNNPLGLFFVLIGMMIGLTCLFAICKCIKDSATLHETAGVEPTQPQVPPAPRTAPPGSPSQQPQEDPPPYSEVASKPFLYPLPAIPPPCYSNVVMADPPATGINHQTTL